VRVPLNDFAWFSRALDFGAEAIITPIINSAADARQFAATQNIRRSVSAMGPRCARWQNPPILAFADEERVVVWRS
jgi:2-keto-3-deoxy-L-rhamnonate aldolase RhmA